MTRDIEDRIFDMAARQHGIVERGQIVEAGLSSSAVSRRLTARRFRQIHRGVYLVGPLMTARSRQLAAVFASGPGAVVSHLSGGSMWEMGVHTTIVEPVDITVAGANRGRRPGIRLHRVTVLREDEWTVLDGVPVTTPDRTLIDLASVIGTRELEAAVARAEREGLVTIDGLSSLLVRHRRRPGMAALRSVIGARGGPALTRSQAEADFLALIRQAALPPPEANVTVGRYEIDFLWRTEGIAVEVDGFRHHSSRPRFESDRRKDAWLLASGITVVRLSWRQIANEGMATAVQVGQALARASRDRR